MTAPDAASGERDVSDLWHLRHIDWLAELGGTAPEAPARGTVERRFERGEMVFAPTPNPHSVYVLGSGLVRIYRLSESGAETSFGYVAPGEVFGELPIFDDCPRESFAQAVRPSVVWKVPRDAFRRLLAERPGLVIQVTKQIGGRLKRIESRVEHLVFRTVRARVARMLIELAEDFGRREAGRVVIDIPITQGEFATLVGATRQTVNQTLREFVDRGLIGREHQHIALFKQDELLQLATLPLDE
jgi:CRP-like cAMP-binding protein